MLLSDGRVLVIGGREYAPSVFYGVPMVDTYDPTSDTWTRGADLPSVPSDGDGGYGGRGFPAVSALAGVNVLVAGGLSLRLVEERKADGRMKFELRAVWCHVDPRFYWIPASGHSSESEISDADGYSRSQLRGRQAVGLSSLADRPSRVPRCQSVNTSIRAREAGSRSRPNRNQPRPTSRGARARC